MDHLPTEQKQLFTDFLDSPNIARMATASMEGRPHVVPVWYGWDGESLWISAYKSTRKVRELEANPFISISIDISEEGKKTLAVIMEGKADLVREPREFLRQQFTWIYSRYLGSEGVKAKSPQEWIADPQNLLIKLTPQKVSTWNW